MSKNRQYNGQKRKNKQGCRKHHTKTKDGATRTPLTSGCRVHRVTLLTNPVLSQE